MFNFSRKQEPWRSIAFRDVYLSKHLHESYILFLPSRLKRNVLSFQGLYGISWRPKQEFGPVERIDLSPIPSKNKLGLWMTRRKNDSVYWSVSEMRLWQMEGICSWVDLVVWKIYDERIEDKNFSKDLIRIYIQSYPYAYSALPSMYNLCSSDTAGRR